LFGPSSVPKPMAACAPARQKRRAIGKKPLML
jgi:hypothetical protein